MITIDRRVRSLAHLASAKAYTSEIRRGKHCAIVFDKHYNVVASFVNCGRVHAEEGAVALLQQEHQTSSNYTLLVVRTMRSTGQTNMSKPCEKCEAAIQNCAKINRVIYSEGNGKYGFIDYK